MIASSGRRILVCGDRRWSDRGAIHTELEFMHGEHALACVIHGAAPGADSFAGEWARLRGVPEIACPADWEHMGRRAGPARNARMMAEEKPDIVLAFHDDIHKSAGTGDMVSRALRKGVRVLLWTHRHGVSDVRTLAAATP